MILPRTSYSSAPPPRTRVQDNPTLLVSWWCTAFAMTIILVRLAGRFVRTERLFREDKIMALSLIPLLVRMGFVHVILLWGTNNTIGHGLTPLEIHHREIGSRLVLASRIMYALFIWVAKFTITEFLKRLTSHVWKNSYEIGLRIIRWFLIVTFVAVVIATLAECQPFNHYWQVIPDPGSKCRQGTAQLYTMGSADIVTDLLIVGFPIPIVIKSAMAIQRKVSLVLLFALSLILVAITVYRMQGVTVRHLDQQFRSLLASLEILAAAAVSNALVLGSFVRDRGTKKQRFRFGSTGDHSSLERSATAPPHRALTEKQWGSDEDLVRDMGIKLGADFTERPSKTPLPAPIALPRSSKVEVSNHETLDPKWSSDGRKSVEMKDLELKSSEPLTEAQPSPGELPTTPRGMSFFDVGGLLDRGLPRTHPHHQSIAVPCHNSQTSLSVPPNGHASSIAAPTLETRRGSHALLQDIGGLLSPSPRVPTPRATAPRPEPSSQQSGLIEALQSTPPNTSAGPSAPSRPRKRPPGLQDVGGLLS